MAKKLGKHQRLVTWKKPAKRPVGSTLNDLEWAALPEELQIRLIRFEYKDRAGSKRRMVLATTMMLSFDTTGANWPPSTPSAGTSNYV